MEAARVGVSTERVRYLAGQYACDGSALVDALVAMATERGRGWWEDYRGRVPSGYLDLAELEHHATRLRTFQSVYIPGLLQSEERVRTIFGASVLRCFGASVLRCFGASVPKLSEEEFEVRVRFRLRRQEVLARRRAMPSQVLLHEAALRIKVADSKVARGQLLYILEQSERPQVAVRVVPFDVDGFAGASDPLV
ncbi:DUF5753 domain-containing protein [Streptomyces chattanoogensis]